MRLGLLKEKWISAAVLNIGSDFQLQNVDLP